MTQIQEKLKKQNNSKYEDDLKVPKREDDLKGGIFLHQKFVE